MVKVELGRRTLAPLEFQSRCNGAEEKLEPFARRFYHSGELGIGGRPIIHRYLMVVLRTERQGNPGYSQGSRCNPIP